MTSEEKKVHRTAYMREYRAKNRDKINEYMRGYRKRNYDPEHEARRQKIKYEKAKDGFHSVYYLPEHHYVGMTNSMYGRLRHHHHSGRLTEGYEVLATFERQVDAHWFETMLHMRGYHGFFVGNNKYEKND